MVLSMMLPLYPSATMTSHPPLMASLASILPMKLISPPLPGGLEFRPGLQPEGVPLAGFGADVEEPHPGILDPQDVGGVETAQIGKLQQILRRTLGVGPAVDEYRLPGGGGDHRAKGRPADALDPLDQQDGRAEQGPGAAGGDKGVPLPPLSAGSSPR